MVGNDCLVALARVPQEDKVDLLKHLASTSPSFPVPVSVSKSGTSAPKIPEPKGNKLISSGSNDSRTLFFLLLGTAFKWD